MDPTPENIARLAHLIWEKEGKPHGCDIKHWCEAESLLMMAKHKKLKRLHAVTTREHLQNPRMNRMKSGRRPSIVTSRANA